MLIFLFFFLNQVDKKIKRKFSGNLSCKNFENKYSSNFKSTSKKKTSSKEKININFENKEINGKKYSHKKKNYSSGNIISHIVSPKSTYAELRLISKNSINKKPISLSNFTEALKSNQKKNNKKSCEIHDIKHFVKENLSPTNIDINNCKKKNTNFNFKENLNKKALNFSFGKQKYTPSNKNLEKEKSSKTLK